MRLLILNKRRKLIKSVLIIILVLIMGILLIPLPVFKPQQSSMLYSKSGEVLSAIISSEEQWCFEMDTPVPLPFEQCVLMYEDEYFYYHPGVNPVSLVKALLANIKSGKVVRGGSTISMQLMRMKNKNAKRSYFNKLTESLAALKYSLWKSKRQILKEWVEMAPFGGNTIGLVAASLRYFNKLPENLTWAEYALLAVMPHSPSSANLSNNRNVLKQKRDFLLKKLSRKGVIPQEDLVLYLEEDLPVLTHQIPSKAYHFLRYLQSRFPDKHLFYTTIDERLQSIVSDLLEIETYHLQIDGIGNAAAVVLDLESNSVVAYIGNAPSADGVFRYVDIAQAQRSYGSLLKPLLYADALESGAFLPKELLPDLPIAIGDFRPMNFDKKYRGAASMDDMLIQSLNVPAVRLLHDHGLQRFYNLLQKLQISGIDKGAEHYGLSIILGGAESTLWDLCRIYKGMAHNYSGEINPYSEVIVLNDQSYKQQIAFSFSPSVIKHTVHAMADVVRPREEKHWQIFSNSSKVAWKTGTSYGHRDAWAIGFNAKYLVGVWIGNESGEGRYQLTGIAKAAPLMFRIFNALPENKWFPSPPTEKKPIQQIQVCTESGKLAGTWCTRTTVFGLHKLNHNLQSCNYHQSVFLNSKGKRVHPACKTEAMKDTVLFVLPSAMDYFYRAHQPSYTGLPAADDHCPPVSGSVKVIYPERNMKIYLPRNSPSTQNKLVAKASCSDPNAGIYWFIDGKFIEFTENAYRHQVEMTITLGKHTLSITDTNGHSDELEIEIIR
jgi:penicillin-binding protein 1C